MQVKVNDTQEIPAGVSEAPKAAVTVDEPKPQVINGQVTITVNDGRSVTLRKMGPMDRMRMCSIIGAENSKNEIYLQAAIPAFCTTNVDGVDVPRSQNVLGLEAIAERLGDTALLEITVALGDYFPDAAFAKVVDELKKRQEIKN